MFGTLMGCDPTHTLFSRVCSCSWSVYKYRVQREFSVLCSDFHSQYIRHCKYTFCSPESECRVGASRVRLVCGVLCHLFELITSISDFVSKKSYLDLFASTDCMWSTSGLHS